MYLKFKFLTDYCNPKILVYIVCFKQFSHFAKESTKNDKSIDAQILSRLKNLLEIFRAKKKLLNFFFKKKR